MAQINKTTKILATCYLPFGSAAFPCALRRRGVCALLATYEQKYIKRRRKTMNKAIITAVSILSTLALATSATAADPEHIEKLDVTGQCVACDLSGADLTDAHLIGVDLRHADLSGANLTGANLEGADLSGANLEGAILDSAFLTNASLKNADLDRVDFTSATINDADVRGASMTDLNLTNARINHTGIAVGGSEE